LPLDASRRRRSSKFSEMHRVSGRETGRAGLVLPPVVTTLVCFGRLAPTREASQSVGRAELPPNSGASAKDRGHRSGGPPDRRRESPVRFGKVADMRGFVEASGEQATAQVRRPAQAQSHRRDARVPWSWPKTLRAALDTWCHPAWSSSGRPTYQLGRTAVKITLPVPFFRRADEPEASVVS